MTLILTLDLDMVKIYLDTKMKFGGTFLSQNIVVRSHSIFYFYILESFTVALKGQGKTLTEYSYTMIILVLLRKSSSIKNVSN